jgi:hypothetical protein
MTWIALIIGFALLIIGITGQFRGVRKESAATHTEGPRLVRWILTIGSVVVGLWIITFFAARLLHFHYTGQ